MSNFEKLQNLETELKNKIEQFFAFPTSSRPRLVKSKDFDEKYELEDRKYSNHKIYDLNQISVIDPFLAYKKQKLYKPKSIHDVVYTKSRLANSNSPSMIFIPTKMVMYKIMRDAVDSQKSY